MIKLQTRRTVVDIDTRRRIVMTARARKPQEVANVSHEQFVRHLLKDTMGWPRREPAPESIKVAAKEIAAVLVKRDIDAAIARQAAKEAEAAAKAKKEAEDAAVEA